MVFQWKRWSPNGFDWLFNGNKCVRNGIEWFCNGKIIPCWLWLVFQWKNSFPMLLNGFSLKTLACLKVLIIFSMKTFVFFGRWFHNDFDSFANGNILSNWFKWVIRWKHWFSNGFDSFFFNGSIGLLTTSIGISIKALDP